MMIGSILYQLKDNEVLEIWNDAKNNMLYVAISRITQVKQILTSKNIAHFELELAHDYNIVETVVKELIKEVRNADKAI